LFAVLLNCPYRDPPVSTCFFPFSSALRRGEGQPHGAFVAGCSQTRTCTLKKIAGTSCSVILIFLNSNCMNNSEREKKEKKIDFAFC